METNTATRILDAAQTMVRNRGYSAFSYADISQEVGIRKASIHYHFPSKEALVTALVQRYRTMLMRQCDRIARSGASPDDQLRQFVALYQNGLDHHQICLCSMLTADFAVLAQPIQDELQTYFRDVEAWVAAVLQQGCEAGHWTCKPSASQEAKSLIALLQGAQLLTRSAANSTEAFEQVVQPVLEAKWLGR